MDYLTLTKKQTSIFHGNLLKSMTLDVNNNHQVSAQSNISAWTMRDTTECDILQAEKKNLQRPFGKQVRP